jgi:ribosome maturation factor RimP
MDALQKINELLLPLLEDGQYFVVESKLSSSKRNPTISIILDSDEGISIDEVAKISRQLGNLLEEQEVMATAYQLEVSSPGVDTPLVSPRQYQRNIGRMIQFTTTDDKLVNAKLLEVHPEHLLVLEEVMRGKIKSVKKENTELALSAVKRAVVQVSFN